MKVPFLDLSPQTKSIQKDYIFGLERIMAANDYVLGEELVRFEENFSRYCKTSHAVGVASGTDAVHLALRALNVDEKKTVILPANTFVATALAAHYTGAKIKLVEPSEETFLVSNDTFCNAITESTGVIISVPLYGRVQSLDQLLKFSSNRNVTVIEDAAHAHGAKVNGRMAGTLGEMGCFSFYPGKNLGALGDGGAVVTANDDLQKKLRELRNYGSEKKYFHPIPGYNSRLDCVQALALNLKLKLLDGWNSARRSAAKTYAELLKGVGDLILPDFPQNSEEHVFHLFVVRSKYRDEIVTFLNEAGVTVLLHYPSPIHFHGAFQYLGHKRGDFPIAEKLSETTFSLPLFPGITADQIDFVVKMCKTFFARKA